ncbi:MAG TPA: cupin domain-containing protein [Gemmataceae bacterium]|jgi:oxalate decarboxylase|nr:cupin domain-containing protein [Gemmataceae bacterium]
MSEYRRREFLAGAAAFAAGVTAALTSGRRADAGDPSFMNNVPDPAISSEELPTFKFALEKSDGRVVGGNTAKEATVKQLPISKGIAGVSMGLAPGGMRELHWHATAAEWAFVDKGRVRTTVLSPGGYRETNEFEAGDVWYFPRGHGHMLECLGDEPCHFVLMFDNGYFSEFGTFSISDWIGHVPKELLAKNFGVAASAFDSFPKKEVYFAQGAKPPAKTPSPLAGAVPGPRTHKYRLLADDPRVNDKGGRLWVVDSKKFPISKTMTGAILELDAGALRELHWHPTADEWQYVFEGQVSVTLFGANGRYRTEVLAKGDAGYIPQGYGHSLENVGDKPCRVLIGFNSGVYEDIDLTEWMAANPTDVLATNFGRPAALFEKFPHKDVFITGKDAK